MSENIKTHGTRTKKTQTALVKSMFALLDNQNFRNISVNDLCGEALVSRAAFYSHFTDKYELMEYSLALLLDALFSGFSSDSGASTADMVNGLVLEHKRIIKNIIDDANEPTLELVQEIIAQWLHKIFGNEHKDPENESYAILLRFYSGGIINLLRWQIKNRFPQDARFLNEDICNVLRNSLH